jgi:uncharacterized protein YkwD
VKVRHLIALGVGVVALVGSLLMPKVDAASVPDAAGCPRSGEMPARGDLDVTRAAVLCVLNAERAKHGLAPLTRNPLLELASQRHSEDMALRKFFEHDTPDGVGSHTRMNLAGYLRPWTGENLYWGTGHKGTPVAAIEGWMNSPGHRANVLRPQFTEVGVGVAYDAPKRGVTDDGAIYTTDFGGG